MLFVNFDTSIGLDYWLLGSWQSIDRLHHFRVDNGVDYFDRFPLSMAQEGGRHEIPWFVGEGEM